MAESAYDSYKPLEAKDVAPRAGISRDVGAELGNRRVAYLGAIAAWFSMATCLVLAVMLAAQVLRNQYIPIPVQDTGHGVVLKVNESFSVADSVLYRPAMLQEFAKDFLELRYAYDYRAGVAQFYAAAQMVKDGYQAGAVSIPRDLITRLEAARTTIGLTFDSVGVRPLAKGIFEVTVLGTKSLTNLNYAAVGPRITPYKEVVTLEIVEVGPKFPRGIAVRGAKGDLDQ